MLHPTIPPRISPAQAFLRRFAQANGLPFADVLSAPGLQRVLDDCAVHFRERIFSPLITVATCLAQALDPDHSQRQAVARLLAHRVAAGLPPCSPDTRAYNKARQRLPESVFAELTRRTGRDLLSDAPPRWGWHGRDVKVVDGTTLSMPDTPANQRAYPQPGTQQPGLGFPQVRMVALFSLAVGTVLDVALGPHKGKGTGEPTLFRTLHHRLHEGDVLLADRYYCGYCQVALVRERGADVVMRQHHLRHTDFRRGRRLGRDDHLVTWSKPKQCPDELDAETFARLPDTMAMREVRVRVPGRRSRCREVVVVTTLLDARVYSLRDIAELYRQRWHAELDLRSLKTFLQLDVLRSRSPALVRKEIWAHLLAYNLIRKVMAQAAREHGVLPRQLSFKGAVQTLNAFADRLRDCAAAELEGLCRTLLAAVARHRVGDRPGRVEPRRKKRRAKPYPLLNQARAQARKAEVNGT